MGGVAAGSGGRRSRRGPREAGAGRGRLPLRFRPDGTFTIVQLTDLHWRNGEAEDRRTAALVGEILDAERPDLAVFTGDVLFGPECRDPVASLRGAVGPVLERGIPWALVFGNHDDEGGASRADLLAAACALPGCLAEPGPRHLPGVGNYRLPVLAAAGDRPAAFLYFLDSLGYAPPQVGGYAWIGHEQVSWYRGLAKDPTVPGLMFFHIPLPEFDEVWRTRPCRGWRGEPVCCPKLNSGLFCALREAGEVLAVFVGHDHLNDFEGELHGIRLCYGRAGGFAGYGREGMARGARMIRLRQGGHGLETWLRLEGGAVVADPPLHLPEG
jgi:hypothetical protein